MKRVLILIGIIIIMAACHSGQDPKSITANESGIHKVNIEEVLQTKQYTILRVKENDAEQWLAIPSMEINKGDIYYYEGGFEMKDFNSKDLKRTFKSIILLESISKEPIVPQNKGMKASEHNMMTSVEKKNVKVEPAKGGITIGELFKNKKSYAGKTVIIRGQVTKYTPAVLNKNWFHLQDGTEFEGNFDLTVTSGLEVKLGDIVTVEGKISLDKDIGAGYVYVVIIEDAVKK